MFVLVVAGGPDKGRVYELTGMDPITLGRGGNLVRLSDRKASRVHARLERDGEAWRLSDNDSRHGTYHNHRRLERDTTLKAGDVVQIGNTVLVVSQVDSSARERDELLSMPAMGGVGDGGGNRWSRVAAVAAVLALGGVVGLGVWDYQTDRERQQRLEALLAELDRPEESATRLADQGAALARIESALAERPREVSAMLEALSARLEKLDSGRARLDAIVASLGDEADRLTPALAGLRTLQQEAAESHRSLSKLAVELAESDAQRGDRFAEVLERLDAQPDADEIARRVAEATLAGVVAELRGLPTQEGLAEAMKSAASEVGRAQARVLGQSIERLTVPADLVDRIAGLERAVADQPTRLEALLAEVRASAQTQAQAERADEGEAQRPALAEADVDRLFAEVAAVKRHVDEQVGQRLDRVIAALDAQPTVEGLAEAVASGSPDAEALRRVAERLVALRNELDALPTTEELSAELKAVLADAPSSDPAVLAALVDRLDRLPEAGVASSGLNETVAGLSDRLAEIEQAVRLQAELPEAVGRLEARLAKLDEGLNADQRAVLDRLAALAELTAQGGGEADAAEAWSSGFEALAEARSQSEARLADRLSKLETTLDELASRQPAEGVAVSASKLAELSDRQAQAAEALREVLDTVREREDLGGLQRQLTDLALLTGSNRQRLEQLVVKVDGDRMVDEQLAKLATRLERWPQESAVQIDRVLAAVRERAGESAEVESAVTEALRKELASLRDWLPDRATLQDEVRLAVATAAPMVVPTSPDAVASASSTPSRVERVKLRSPGSRGERDADAAATAEPTDASLTPTEHSYRVAFQTGQPVTVGAGEIDPVTGKVSSGRRIDPAAAREAGFETWRQWYASDMFAERMRQQRAATRHLQVDQKSEPIRLPDE